MSPYLASDARDFANPIEPSGAGGRKIALAIAGAVGAVESPGRRSIRAAG